ncbi:MAG TPA: phage tail protein [Gemmatimonadales bacterium]|nr:phage tail protein [Gemmatimonadales bacterium]
MAILRDRPYPSMNFTVDLGTGVVEGSDAGLLEVIFPEARIQINEYRNGSDKVAEPVKISALTHYGNLLLRRGAIGSLNWYQWWNESRNGNPAIARNVLVQLLNEDRTAVVLTWKFYRAVPANYHFAPLNALAGETLIENLELAFERMEME